MNFDVFEILSKYINNTSVPVSAKWLPIVALVILWFEVRYLMFRSPKKQELEDQLSQSELLQIYYKTRLREILLFVLATTLVWSLFFSFIFLCQQLLNYIM